jgi:hypothetical protein
MIFLVIRLPKNDNCSTIKGNTAKTLQSIGMRQFLVDILGRKHGESWAIDADPIMTMRPAAKLVSGGRTLQMWRHNWEQAVPVWRRRIKWVVGEFERARTIKFL